MIAISDMTGEFEAVADVATGALAAKAVDAPDRHAHSHSGICLNCDTVLMGPHCHECGQSSHVHRTAAALFHDIAHGVFHFEGRTWHTLPMLFRHPGHLTRRYVQGERVKFVSPMALFLFSVFLMVATFSWVGGPTGEKTTNVKIGAAQNDTAGELQAGARTLERLQVRRAQAVAQGKPADTIASIDEDIADAKNDVAALKVAAGSLKAAGQRKSGADRDGLETIAPDDVPRTGLPVVDGVIAHAAENPSLTAYKLQSSAYKFSWALIPISLPFIWLLFAFRRDVGMYDHAIFATYSLSAMTLMVVALSIAAAIGLWAPLIWLTLFFFPPWHMYRQLKEAYGLQRFGAFWRMVALIIAAYTSALIFFIFLLAMGLGH